MAIVTGTNFPKGLKGSLQRVRVGIQQRKQKRQQERAPKTDPSKHQYIVVSADELSVGHNVADIVKSKAFMEAMVAEEVELVQRWGRQYRESPGLRQPAPTDVVFLGQSATVMA